MNVLGFIQLFSSAFLLMGFCINRINLIIKSGWRKKQAKNQVTLADDIKHVLNPLIPDFGELKIEDLSLLAARTLLLTEGPDHPAFRDSKGRMYFNYTALYFEYKWINLSFLMQDSDFIFALAYLAFSMQGLIQSPIFYTLHLADIVNRFP